MRNECGRHVEISSVPVACIFHRIPNSSPSRFSAGDYGIAESAVTKYLACVLVHWVALKPFDKRQSRLELFYESSCL